MQQEKKQQHQRAEIKFVFMKIQNIIVLRLKVKKIDDVF